MEGENFTRCVCGRGGGGGGNRGGFTILSIQPGEARVPVILTDVDEDGVVTVQLRGHGFNFLQLLMNQINEKYKVRLDSNIGY